MKRVYVRVEIRGKEPARELVVDGEPVLDMSFLETVDMISEVLDALRAGTSSIHLAVSDDRCVEMTFVDGVEFAMQGISTLRYEMGL